MLNYFDELDIHALTINAEANSSEKMLDAFVKHLGRPRNYGPSMEELREKKRGEEEKRERECLASEEERSRKEKDDVEKHIRAVAQWVRGFNLVDDTFEFLLIFVLEHSNGGRSQAREGSIGSPVRAPPKLLDEIRYAYSDFGAD